MMLLAISVLLLNQWPSVGSSAEVARQPVVATNKALKTARPPTPAGTLAAKPKQANHQAVLDLTRFRHLFMTVGITY
jgi:hypothetical protein